MRTPCESQGNKVGSRPAQIFVAAPPCMDAVEAAHHVPVHHVHHRLGHRVVHALVGQHTFLHQNFAHVQTQLHITAAIGTALAQGVQVFHIAHGQAAAALGVVSLDHHKGLFVDAIFLVFAPHLGQQRIHMAAQDL